MNIKDLKASLKEEAKFQISNKLESINYQDYLPEKRKKTFVKLNLVKVFSGLVFIVFISAFTYFSFMPVSNLRIEINPSLSLELNRFNRVVKVSGENEDADNLIADLNLRYKSLDKALTLIYDFSEDQGYSVDGNLYVLYAIESVNQENKILELLNTTLTENVKFIVISKQTYNTEFSVLLPSNIPESSYDYQAGNDNPQDIPNFSSDIEAILDQAQLSELRLKLIIEIFIDNEEFTTAEDLEYLISLDIDELFAIYK